ncbi:MAG: HPr family phosphocarrier protein [Cellulomonadaceae bacterium]|nr:HPr family phosphocarrier protein [Cellulomonadaceae bacterium]
MERTAVIASKLGLHARPAQTFTKAVAASGAKVTIGRPGGKAANAASLLSVMGMGLKGGEEIVLVSDDADVLDSLVKLVETDLDAE